MFGVSREKVRHFNPHCLFLLWEVDEVFIKVPPKKSPLPWTTPIFTISITNNLIKRKGLIKTLKQNKVPQSYIIYINRHNNYEDRHASNSCHIIQHHFPFWVLLMYSGFGVTIRKHLFIYFQFIYRWQILFHRTIRLAFHKQQGLSQTSGAINSIVECCYRWH